jgi:hypothetical protein
MDSIRLEKSPIEVGTMSVNWNSYIHKKSEGYTTVNPYKSQIKEIAELWQSKPRANSMNIAKRHIDPIIEHIRASKSNSNVKLYLDRAKFMAKRQQASTRRNRRRGSGTRRRR